MNIDSEAAILSIMHFLTPYEILNYLSINKEVYDNYNNEKIWYKILPVWNNIELIDLKKSLHFAELASKYSLPELMDEVTNQNQLNVVKIYVRKSSCSKTSKNILNTMILELTPFFLKPKKTYMGFYAINLRHVMCMKKNTLQYLMSKILT